jgi:hypothetical protein
MASTRTEENVENLLASILEMTPKVGIRDINVLAKLLRESPGVAGKVWDFRGVVPKLAELQECGIVEVEEQARVCLSLLGYVPLYAGRGLRILSIDGGGTRLVHGPGMA